MMRVLTIVSWFNIALACVIKSTAPHKLPVVDLGYAIYTPTNYNVGFLSSFASAGALTNPFRLQKTSTTLPISVMHLLPSVPFVSQLQCLPMAATQPLTTATFHVTARPRATQVLSLSLRILASINGLSTRNPQLKTVYSLTSWCRGRFSKERRRLRW